MDAPASPPSPLAELRADLARNVVDAREQLLDDPAGKHLKDTIWPWLEGLCDKLEEYMLETSAAVTSLIEEDEEVLFGESGAKLIGLIAMGGELAIELKRRITNAKDNSPLARSWLAKIDAYAEGAAEMVPFIQEITIDDEVEPMQPPTNGAGAVDDDDEDEEDDDGDE